MAEVEGEIKEREQKRPSNKVISLVKGDHCGGREGEGKRKRK